MALLQDILYKAGIRSVTGRTDVEIKNVQFDSRKVVKDSLFVAIKGISTDGHEFIEKAVKNGAVAVIAEELPSVLKEGVTFVQVENSSAAAGFIAHNFYGQPSEKLKLVGVTGTNGKTTIATLLYKLFTALGYQCGLLSTVQNRIGEKSIEATHTTPDQVSINSLLSNMVNAGCTHVFMECSSHAIHQHRIAGLKFAG
ncbi:MAG: Mur ligase family protein, partial [Chitinophagaceae bacterium]